MLEYSEITEIVQNLDNDFSTLREDARRRYDLYRMRKEPYVPEEIAREGKVRMTSSLVMWAAETIRADIMMNPTEFTVIPLAREKSGIIPKANDQKAQNVEKAMAILWGRMNEGRRIDRDVIWHQLVSPYAIMMLEFLELQIPDQPDGMNDKVYNGLVDNYLDHWIPWHVYMPDPMTCSWMERDGKPVLFARKYNMLVKDVERMYSHASNSIHPDKRCVYDQGNFQWVSDDYPTNSSHYRSGFEEVEVEWLDNGQEIYMICKNPGSGNDSGLMLSCVPNPLGRCTGFIVPGNMTPDRRPEDRYEPFLLPLMQTVNEINDIRSMRATAARNLAGPHTYVTIDPEIQKLYMTRGEKLPTEVRWKKNVTHYLLGKVEVIPSELSQDWDKVEERINEDLQHFLPSPFINIVDPAVLKAATATSILHAAEAGLRMYGPLMSAYDAAIHDICDAVLTTIKVGYNDEPVRLYATGDEMARGKNVKSGSVYILSEKDLDFSYQLAVKTRGMSQAQAQAQYQAVLAQWILPDGSKGPATLDDLIEAANYTDPVAQRMKLSKEGIMNNLDAWIQQMAMTAARQEILVDSQIDIPIGMQQQMGGGAAQTPSAMPNQAQRMDAPMVAGPEGGSNGGATT